MKDMILNDFENIKVVFERMDGDRRYILVNILWKQAVDFAGKGDTEVWVEAGVGKKQKVRMEKIKDTEIWHAAVKINNTLDEVYYFDRTFVLKLVRSEIITYNPHCSYAV